MKTKNLTISNTFNDFALQTESIDYDVEDLVSYCLENTSVFYWLNIESIWGLVGFQWDEFENRGHFNVNPVKFNILPKVPDAYRLKSFKGLFSNLKTSTPISIIHNTWDNIDTIGNWNHPDVIIHVDENHNFTKISSTNSTSDAITNEGAYFYKITLKGGDYSKIQDIGQRTLVYDGENLNVPLLTLLRDYPSYSENKYQFIRVFTEDVENELSASNFIQLDENTQLTSTNEYMPSICLYEVSDIKLNVDLKLFVKDDVKVLHTLFSNFKGVSQITVNNTLKDIDDVYILFAGGIGNWDSTTFLYRGVDFNLPIYKSGIDISQAELESIPVKYNLFTNPNHKCRYWDFTMQYYLNTNSIRYNNITLKQGIWLKQASLIDINKPLKLDIDATLLSELDKNNCTLIVDEEKAINIDGTALDATEVIQKSNQEGGLCKLKALNNKDYNVLFTDINYTQSDSSKAELFEISDRIYIKEKITDNKTEIEPLYYASLNDSYNNIENIKTTTRNVVLSQNLAIPGTYNMIVLKNSPYKIKLPDDAALKLEKLIICDNVIKPFIEIPQLKYPINDPDNYEYNHKISENYKINFQSETLIDELANDVRLENRQPYFLNYPFNSYAYYLLNTYLYSKYSNTFTSVPTYKQRLCTMRLSDLIAVDYPNSIVLNHQAWFTDESDMSDLEKLRTPLKEKVDEFYNKIMLNPAYKGQKDKSIIRLSSEQYALFDKEQIETLVEYGYAIQEQK